MLWQACTGGESHCASLEEPSDHIVRFVESFQVRVLSSCIHTEKKREEKMPFGVNSMRSQVLYRAAQVHSHCSCRAQLNESL